MSWERGHNTGPPLEPHSAMPKRCSCHGAGCGAMSGVLAGRHVVITGASRGIGAAAARELARAGASLGLVARDGERLAGVAAEIAAAGGAADARGCDVADFAAVAAAVDHFRGRFGPVAVLVNNAGVIAPSARLAEGDPALWARNIAVNLVGAYNMVCAVLPEMAASGAGRIVNLSSGAALRPMEGWSAYCAAKAGLAMLTRAIALEAGASGVRVFGFGPGTTDTDMQAEIRASGLNRVSRIPREALTPPAAVARAILYLCTPAADDLSGGEVALGDPDFRRRIGLD
jgi:NAD(P)-dependent dehydrogenase (short-subunit alcohol dehydrogenase family)